MKMKVQSVPIFKKVSSINAVNSFASTAKVQAAVAEEIKAVEAMDYVDVAEMQIKDETPIIEQTTPISTINTETKIDENAPFLYITGAAGTGKTTLIKQQAQFNPNYIELGATTGIAAINLDTKTINSLLKYYDAESLRYSYMDGKLHYYLRLIREEKKALGIEEASMLSAEILDYIFDAIYEINQDANPKKLGLHLIGDLLQLPPVKAEMIISAKCWPYFQQNTIRLKKIWRQDNPEFISAINLIRAGDGYNAVNQLIKCGVQFISQIIDKFDGTTLIPKNDQVDDYNFKRLADINSPIINSVPMRRGEQLGEWKSQVPNLMRFKIGAYIMILSNDCPDFTYVNGDCGTIISFNEKEESFKIRLKRNDKEVDIKKLTRMNTTAKQPTAAQFNNSSFTPYIDQFSHKWVIGDITYHPLRLAYATTIHKSQGLSLDKVQINISPWNFGLPGMAYTAISRSKTPQGLIIVGTPEMLVKKIVTEKSILNYI